MERPLGVTILAVLAALGGLISLLGALSSAMLVSSIASSVGYESAAAGLSGMLLLIGLVGAAIEFLVAYGYWTGKSWAWWITVILGSLEVLLSVIGIILAPASIFGAIISLVITLVVLWYLFKPHVKEYFGVNVGFST